MCADNKGTHRRAVHTSGRAERCNAHRACNLTISKRCDDWMMGPPCNTCYTPKGLEPVGFDWLGAGFSSECCTAERAAPAAASLNASVWATVVAPFTAADNHTRMGQWWQRNTRTHTCTRTSRGTRLDVLEAGLSLALVLAVELEPQQGGVQQQTSVTTRQPARQTALEGHVRA